MSEGGAADASETISERVTPKGGSIGSIAADDVFGRIERLHDLHRKGIVDDAEFVEKKRELLARI